MSIQAVLFDLDNTLTHRDLSIQAYSQLLLDQFQTDLTQRDATQLDQIMNIIRRIDNGGYPQKKYLTHPSIAASVAQALITELSWTQPPQLDDLTVFWFERFGLSAVAMPGAEALLKQLKQHDYTLAVISNGGHATRLKILEGLGFLDHFDEVFSSESVGISKPHPDIFIHSCQRLNIAPSNSLFVGDHPINDYSGARSAGLKALLLDGFHAVDELHPSAAEITRIQHLSQVLEYLI